jgi:hypothetical protein
MDRKPILITLSGGTAGGKSFLFNYIRDIAKLPCLISTTTRPMRVGEAEGVDYFFISEEESRKLEAANQFAELAIYNGVRYGVTRSEFQNKMDMGLAFLICEPTGVEHYAQPAIDMGAHHLKVYVHSDPEVRVARFKERTLRDLEAVWAQGVNATNKVVSSALTRLQSMVTEEMRWGEIVQYDMTVFGTESPAYNLELIKRQIAKLHAHDLDVEEFNERTPSYEAI